ncbi:hypothetical protein [Candidatus Sororendozoicomonas aggregata]|uniref:hypothetical protein n=1 Tax=Candidatus Sororendozoicomonas aggregata TaxID=3073239 RepID=UPI002ED556E3
MTYPRLLSTLLSALTLLSSPALTQTLKEKIDPEATVLVWFGSFDPVHNNRIATAQAALKEKPEAKIVIIANNTNSHKPNRSDFNHRFNMLNLAFEDERRVIIAKENDSEVLKILKDKKATIIGLSGGDLLELYNEIGDSALPSITEPDGCKKKFKPNSWLIHNQTSQPAPDIPNHFPGTVSFIPSPEGTFNPKLNSTLVRKVYMTDDVKALLPAKVMEYARRHHLWETADDQKIRETLAARNWEVEKHFSGANKDTVVLVKDKSSGEKFVAKITDNQQRFLDSKDADKIIRNLLGHGLDFGDSWQLLSPTLVKTEPLILQCNDESEDQKQRFLLLWEYINAPNGIDYINQQSTSSQKEVLDVVAKMGQTFRVIQNLSESATDAEVIAKAPDFKKETTIIEKFLTTAQEKELLDANEAAIIRNKVLNLKTGASKNAGEGESPPITCLHLGDAHIGNMLVDARKKRIYLIDLDAMTECTAVDETGNPLRISFTGSPYFEFLHALSALDVIASRDWQNLPMEFVDEIKDCFTKSFDLTEEELDQDIVTLQFITAKLFSMRFKIKDKDTLTEEQKEEFKNRLRNIRLL